MISKELFIQTVEFMQEQDNKQSKLCEALEDMALGFRCDALVYCGYNTQMVNLLHAGLNLPENSETLEYWLWDLDFGRQYKPSCFTDENNKPIDISTVDKLYDYLITIAEK